MAITDTLLALTDFQNIKELSVNINDARILPYVREAQRIDLVKFMGRALYFDWMVDQTAGVWAADNYQELFDGASYNDGSNTVQCHGLKLTLLYFSLARFLKNQDINITSYGVRILNDGDLSEREQMAQIRTKAGEALSIAVWYQSECRAFISANSGDFPLFSSADRPKEMSFKMIKVI